MDWFPIYISNIFPNTVGTIAPEYLRNATDYTVLNMRTQIFANSFIPSCVAVWNSFPKELIYPTTFKCNLTNTFFKVKPTLLHYFMENRKLSVLLAALEMEAVTYPLTRLRNVYSDLSLDTP